MLAERRSFIGWPVLSATGFGFKYLSMDCGAFHFERVCFGFFLFFFFFFRFPFNFKRSIYIALKKLISLRYVERIVYTIRGVREIPHRYSMKITKYARVIVLLNLFIFLMFLCFYVYQGYENLIVRDAYTSHQYFDLRL